MTSYSASSTRQPALLGVGDALIVTAVFRHLFPLMEEFRHLAANRRKRNNTVSYENQRHLVRFASQTIHQLHIIHVALGYVFTLSGDGMHASLAVQQYVDLEVWGHSTATTKWMTSTILRLGSTHTALLMPQSRPRPVAFSCSTSKEALRCARYSLRFSFAIRGLDGLWSRTVNPSIPCFVDKVDVLCSRNNDADSSFLPVLPEDKRIVQRPAIIIAAVGCHARRLHK